MEQIQKFGADLWDMIGYISDVVNTPLLRWDYQGVTHNITLAGLLLGGTVFAIMTYKIIKFLIP